MSNLSHLDDLHALEAAIEESRTRPVLLFKHSRTCGVSFEALDELRAHLETARSPAAYKMITVQSHRHVSDHAAARLGVRHETPQAILIRDGRPVWKASHFRITAGALADALHGSHQGAPGAPAARAHTSRLEQN
jgi:bacillithiol system protein YtxJ